MKTAQLNEKPQILFLGLPDKIHGLVKKNLQPGLNTLFLPIAQLPNKETLAKFHKIVLFFTLSEDLELKKTLSALTSFQAKLLIVIPHVQSYKTLISQVEKPRILKLWDKMLVLQEAWYEFIHQAFATTQLMFFDGLSFGRAGSPILSLPLLLLVDINKGLIYSIKNQLSNFSLIDEVSFCSSLCEYVKKPAQSRSVLIHSTPTKQQDFVGKTTDLCKLFFQKEVVEFELFVETITTLPFSPATQCVALNLSNVVRGLLHDGLSLDVVAQLDRFLTQNQKNQAQEKEFGDDFSHRLGGLFGKNRKEKKQEYIAKIVGVEKRERKRNLRRKLFFAGGVMSALLASLVIFSSLRFYFYYQGFVKNILEFSQQTLSEEVVDWGVLENLHQEDLGIQSKTKTWSNLISHPIFDQASITSNTIEQLIKYRQHKQEYQEAKEAILSQILGQTENMPGDPLDSIAISGQALVDARATVIDNLEKLSSEFSPGEVFLSNSQKSAQLLALYNLFKPRLMDILGFNEQKLYAVVFQDSAELRPTGGFINAVGLLRLKNGRLVSYKTLESHRVNAMLGGVVAPPEEVVQLLDEKNWYFHDSNWDADFPTTAETITWFLEKSLGESPDGVIAFNSTSFFKLLGGISPIVLREHPELINQENFISSLDAYAKKDVITNQVFVSALLSGFIEKVFAQNTMDFEKWLVVFVDELSAGQIQVYLKDSLAQKILVQTRWSGLVAKPSCLLQFAKNGCLADSVYQVEANVGINRANAQLETAIHDRVEFQTDRVSRVRKTTWTNNAISNLWPKGAYKTYVRWYLPKEAFLDDLLVNNASIFGQGSKVYFEHDRLVVAATLEIGVQSSLTTELKYHFSFDLQKPVAYVLTDQIQPGKVLDQFGVTLTHPPSLQPSKITPQGDLADGAATFIFKTNEPRIVGIEFEQKNP